MKRLTRSALGLCAGVVVGIAACGGFAFATGRIQTISARFDDIALVVNGQTIPTTAQPLIYKGNVYVPISAIAHGLGATATWDGKAREVLVTPGAPVAVQARMVYAGQPFYGTYQDVKYKGAWYASADALAVATAQPEYYDSTTHALYIGYGPLSGMPLYGFADVRAVGDYAASGPTFGWASGVPHIGQIPYENAAALVWGAKDAGSVVPAVEYDLHAHYQALTGAFGMDDDYAGAASVRLVVMGDGHTLYASPYEKSGEKAQPIDVNVRGIHLLTIGFAVRLPSGKTIYQGQPLPPGYPVEADFVDVSVH